MIKLWLAVSLFAIGAPGVLAATQPSFDCAGAHSKIERLICSDDELAGLDRELATAYLAALRTGAVDKELQVEWIRRNNECLSGVLPEQCLSDRIKQRIKDLRGDSVWPKRGGAADRAIGRPTLAETRDVCDHIASRGPSIAEDLITSGDLEANNDGKLYAVSIGISNGTMAGEDPEFRPKGAPPRSDPIEIAQKGFEWKDYNAFGAGWLKRGRYVYTLYFDTERHRHPLYLGFIDSENVEHVACDFTVVDRETLYPERPEAARVCQAVADDRVRYLEVKPASIEERDRDIGREQTKLDGWVSADFLNTGHREPLALLAFEGTAARGCNFSYYEALDGDHLAAGGEAHDLLMKLQTVEHGLGPSCDGNRPRWFEYHGRTYLDDRPSSAVSTYPSAYVVHEVTQIISKDVRRVCYARTDTKSKVNSLWPHL